MNIIFKYCTIQIYQIYTFLKIRIKIGTKKKSLVQLQWEYSSQLDQQLREQPSLRQQLREQQLRVREQQPEFVKYCGFY
jgi:hypothetical protein